MPVFLYSSIVSRDIASRENWSFLPLYLSWIFLSCGATSSMRRWLLIWRTKIGISAARTTMTRPTIESTHVTPASGSRPKNVHIEWKATRISSITHLMGQRIRLRMSMGAGQSFRDRVGEEFMSAGSAASGRRCEWRATPASRSSARRVRVRGRGARPRHPLRPSGTCPSARPSRTSWCGSGRGGRRARRRCRRPSRDCSARCATP